MVNSTRFYVDGVNDISFINGMIHITCGNLEKPEDPKVDPVSVNGVSLALSVQGFLQTFQQMNNMMAAMKDQGILRDTRKEAVEPAE